MTPGQCVTPGGSAAASNGTAPRCQHLDGLVPVTPRSAACPDCPDPQARLVVCLTCGWVACSDDSPGRHARAHYEETDHPVTADLAPGAARRWCYAHQRLV
jgi:uncharacterized UBP type Zn finger protein